MARPTWKGVLKIAMVHIPIKVYPATESSSGLSFNQLHADCQTRLTQKKWCVACDKEIATAEIVKGFEFEPGKYVLVLDAELEAMKPPSARRIDLVRFADASELDPSCIDRSYYLAPDGPLAGEAFTVMRLAMTSRVGIGKLAIYGREYLVAVRPALVPTSASFQPVLMLHTLHHAAEMRPIEAIKELQILTSAPSDQVRLARQVITAYAGPLDLADFTDEHQIDVRRLIDAKIAGEEIVVPRIETPHVVSLGEALAQSLLARAVGKTIRVKVPASLEKRKRA
jgi:DNA end-binding protein Ku